MAGATAASQESEILDFKAVGRSIPDTLRNLAEAAACLANARGGTIVVGVRDGDPGQEAFVGSGLDPAKTVRDDPDDVAAQLVVRRYLPK